MASRERARTAARRSRATVAAVILLGATLIGLLVERSSATSGDHATAMPTLTPGAMQR